MITPEDRYLLAKARQADLLREAAEHRRATGLRSAHTEPARRVTGTRVTFRRPSGLTTALLSVAAHAGGPLRPGAAVHRRLSGS